MNKEIREELEKYNIWYEDEKWLYNSEYSCGDLVEYIEQLLEQNERMAKEVIKLKKELEEIS